MSRWTEDLAQDGVRGIFQERSSFTKLCAPSDTWKKQRPSEEKVGKEDDSLAVLEARGFEEREATETSVRLRSRASGPPHAPWDVCTLTPAFPGFLPVLPGPSFSVRLGGRAWRAGELVSGRAIRLSWEGSLQGFPPKSEDEPGGEGVFLGEKPRFPAKPKARGPALPTEQSRPPRPRGSRRLGVCCRLGHCDICPWAALQMPFPVHETLFLVWLEDAPRS